MTAANSRRGLRPAVWRQPAARIPANTLTFREVVTLRRVRNGDSQAEIARVQGVSEASISKALKAARERFDVGSNRELLAHPSVVEQLREDGAS